MEKKQVNKLQIKTQDGQAFRVPVEGSLGLLALGYKGLIAWRQARFQYQKMKESQKQAGENTGNAENA